MNRLLALLVLPLGAAFAAAQPLPFDNKRLTDVERDGTGQVWACSSSPRDILHRWTTNAWKPAHVSSSLSNATPRLLARGSNGIVFCLWSRGSESSYSLPREAADYAVSSHFGDSSKLLVQFHEKLNEPNLFGDSRGNLWITQRGEIIYRANTNGQFGTAYTIPENQLHRRGKAREFSYNPVRAAEDAKK